MLRIVDCTWMEWSLFPVSFYTSQLIPDYDWRTKSRFNTKTIQQLYHDDMNVTSHLLANLKLSFYWRNLINEDLLSLFKRWASTESHTQVPDFILFGEFHSFVVFVVLLSMRSVACVVKYFLHSNRPRMEVIMFYILPVTI
jgi:hypothetical protein